MIKKQVLHSTKLLVLTATVLVGWCQAESAKAEFDVNALQERIHSTIENVQPAVVSIRQQGGLFSGVIVSGTGTILSAGHAVDPGKRYQVFLPDGRRFTAVGKGTNPRADCALLQITDKVEDLPFVRIGDSSTVVVNQPCLSLSFPGGQGNEKEPRVRFGRVVSVGNTLQSTALMEPGDSGGPLFDLQGRVIGIHSRIGRQMDRNYEVPVNTFKQYWNELHREEVFTGGPSAPKLGFRGKVLEDGSGIQVISVEDKGLAKEHGIEKDDIVNVIQGTAVSSVDDLKKALLAAVEDPEITEIVVGVRRGEEELRLPIPYEFKDESAPDVALPTYEPQEFAEPVAIEQLAGLPKFFSELESQLDDACVEIMSKSVGGEEFKIHGTLIRDTHWVISKSSMVLEGPKMVIEETELELEVVNRDLENELVLLKSSQQNSSGVALNVDDMKTKTVGSFVMTPDQNGSGLISIISTPPYASRKQVSRGYLGVVPETYEEEGGGAILREVVRRGAAQLAGLKVGDVITQLDETPIKSHMELRRFLGKLDPGRDVVALIKRGSEQLEIQIQLGAFPSSSNHVADKMSKSDRRDGFEEVISHDADLKPQKCGGPLFDLQGNFV
ncbi:MAG: trypsin-like peptidase domain-containing protein, partial [Planctomycetota bacterium]|nr:trypsin-like peptidase domain-containing protein [Planctomycetota bacterium]